MGVLWKEHFHFPLLVFHIFSPHWKMRLVKISAREENSSMILMIIMTMMTMTLGESFHTSSFPQVGIGVKTLLQMQIIFSSRKFEKNSSGIL